MTVDYVWLDEVKKLLDVVTEQITDDDFKEWLDKW